MLYKAYRLIEVFMEIRRLNPQCINCLVKKQLENYPKAAQDSDKIRYMQKVLDIIAKSPMSMSAPEIVNEIYNIQKEMFAAKQDYSEIKRYFNSLMLETEKALSDETEKSDTPLKTAVQYAMTGNYIDFGAMDRVDESKLRELLDNAKNIEIDENEFRALQNDLAKAGHLVYLTDNCGEIVLDKLLISVIKKLYPTLEITAIVRGAEVLNDADIEDAKQVALTDLVKVIDNGSDIAGTCLDKISVNALKTIDNADVIISKGQGNFETLNRCGRNIYYMFMCKCKLFSDRFGVPLYSGMLINDKALFEIM